MTGIRVAFVAVRAIAIVSGVVTQVMSSAIPATWAKWLALILKTFVTRISIYCPIKHQWQTLFGEITKIIFGESKLAFFDNKGVGAGVEILNFFVSVKARDVH